MKRKVLLLLSFIICYGFAGQSQGIKVGDVLHVTSSTKALNYSAPTANFSNFKSRLTIIDFFGTWCVPCLKALPHLTQLKEKFSSDLSVVLVSNETEAQLIKFIKARPAFAFPVLVDEKNVWNDAFSPPSLPYTAVINRRGPCDSPDRCGFYHGNFHTGMAEWGRSKCSRNQPCSNISQTAND